MFVSDGMTFKTTILLIALAIMSWMPSAVAADPEPEFDGVYLLSKSGNFVELAETTVWRSVLLNPDGQQLSDRVRTVFYMIDKSKRGVVKAAEFSAIAVRGKWAGSQGQLHKLGSATLAPKEAVQNETEPLIKKGKPYFVANGSFELRTKSSGQTRYHVPKQPLGKGEYVVNLNGHYWIMELQ